LGLFTSRAEMTLTYRWLARNSRPHREMELAT